jgi:hypothetical protein
MRLKRQRVVSGRHRRDITGRDHHFSYVAGAEVLQLGMVKKKREN